MKFILTAGWEDGIADLTARLVRELVTGKQVLWLVSGGSNIPASVQVMETIADEQSQCLSIMLADERYGPPGHDDSNWTGLLQAGFNAKHARLLPVLEPGMTFAKTTAHYEKLAQKAFAEHDIVIAQLGIGADGHIAGILPKSTAAQEQTAFVTGYEAGPLQRLTLTFPALRHVTAAYAFAFGSAKQRALATLQDKDLKPVQQPAQILKDMAEAYIYNDQVGEHT